MINWHDQWVVLLLLCSWPLVRLALPAHSPRSLRLFLFLTLVSVILTGTDPNPDAVFFAVSALGAGLSVLLYTPLFWLPSRTWRFLLAAFCGVASAHSLGQYVLGARPPLGVTQSAGLTGTCVAVTLPFLWRWTFQLPGSAIRRWVVRLAPILACWVSNSSMAYGVLGVVLAWSLVRSRLWLLGVAALPWSLGVGHLLQNRALLDTRNRTSLWKMALDWWWHDSNRWWGSGVGSLSVQLPQLQYLHDPKTTWLSPWLHNDWLTVLIEQGIVGFTCLLVLFGYTVWKARHWVGLQAAVLGYGAAAVGQFLPHGALSAALGIGLLTVTWRGDGGVLPVPRASCR